MLRAFLGTHEEMVNKVCQGDAFMTMEEVQERLDHEKWDDCAPYWALPMSRFSFTRMLASAWPTFQLLQLLSIRISSRWVKFLCTFAEASKCLEFLRPSHARRIEGGRYYII